jgi:hypothetical protein
MNSQCWRAALLVSSFIVGCRRTHPARLPRRVPVDRWPVRRNRGSPAAASSTASTSIIENNVIRSPVGKKFRGIDGNAGGSVMIRNNSILASGPADKTSFGITFNNHSGTIISSGNTFKNLGKNMLGDIIDRDPKP